MNYLIQNASLVNEGEIFEADVLISDGIISRIAGRGELDGEGAKVVDAKGKYLIPGIIDEHVHFRDPGLTQKGDIYTESRAAVAGGVTSFMDMPNTIPQTTTGALLEEKFEMASQKSLANYSFYIGATNDNLRDLLGIDFSKVCGIKIFFGSSTGNMLVDRDSSLEAIFREAPCLIAAHCEDERLIKEETEKYRKMVQDGSVISDASIHPFIRSAEACLRSTSHAIDLAEKTGARLHVLHVSTAAELGLFRNDLPLESKKITAETCPHYLFFDDSSYANLGFAVKCNPAIKSSSDRDSLLQALRNGLIDTIGTDHAPHLRDEKFTGDYFSAKSGFPSVQHSLEVMDVISRDGLLTLPQLVRLMCHNPAILYRIDRRGFICEGYHADLVIVDMNAPHLVADAPEYSKCGWSPYAGTTVKSKVTHTFVNGNLVYENGNFYEGSRGVRLEFRTPE